MKYKNAACKDSTEAQNRVTSIHHYELNPSLSSSGWHQTAITHSDAGATSLAAASRFVTHSTLKTCMNQPLRSEMPILVL